MHFFLFALPIVTYLKFFHVPPAAPSVREQNRHTYFPWLSRLSREMCFLHWQRLAPNKIQPVYKKVRVLWTFL